MRSEVSVLAEVDNANVRRNVAQTNQGDVRAFTTPSKRPKVPSRIGGNGVRGRGVCCIPKASRLVLGLKLKAGEKARSGSCANAESLALSKALPGQTQSR